MEPPRVQAISTNDTKTKLHSQGPLWEPPCVQTTQTHDTKTKLQSQGPLLDPPCVQAVQTTDTKTKLHPRSAFGTSPVQTIQRLSDIPKVHFGTSLCAGDTNDTKTKLHSQGPLLEPPRVQTTQTNDTKTKLHSLGPLLEPPCVQTTQATIPRQSCIPKVQFGNLPACERYKQPPCETSPRTDDTKTKTA